MKISTLQKTILIIIFACLGTILTIALSRFISNLSDYEPTIHIEIKHSGSIYEGKDK